MSRRRPRRRSEKTGLPWVLGLVGVIWLVFLVDAFVFRGALTAHGIRPRTLRGLEGILFAPFLHGGLEHLLSNTVPLLILGTLIALRGRTELLEVTGTVVVLGGLGTWAIGAEGTHVGASGVVFGWFAHLLLRGALARDLVSVVTALVVGVLYGGLIWGVLPIQEGVSWEGHLSGFLAGAIAAWLTVRFGTPAAGRRSR